ncbi:hypothetical protein WBG78_19145 [Chryseolinea sp. T2]|uniref:hypothetical protein n=1 Tax=Chryseolinea sp. T2 TaxID=3129255 RepID=UPI003077D69E
MGYDLIQELTSAIRVEQTLIEKLGLSQLKVGIQIIRDERGWRQDERLIEYIWVVHMSRSFVGWGGIIGVKFGVNDFRGKHHNAELLHGVFNIGIGNVVELYSERLKHFEADPVFTRFPKDLFHANEGLALDGTSYAIHIMAPNTDVFVSVNSPIIDEWKEWTQEVWSLGSELSVRSQSRELMELFS